MSDMLENNRLNSWGFPQHKTINKHESLAHMSCGLFFRVKEKKGENVFSKPKNTCFCFDNRKEKNQN